MKRMIDQDLHEFEAVHTAVSKEILDGEEVIRVVKADKIM